MDMNNKVATTLLAGAALAIATPAMADNHAEPSCDRACLIDLADDYTDTFVSGDATGIGLADDAVIFEDLAPIAAGEGLWASITGGKTDFNVTVADPVSQQVGILTVMSEGDAQVLVGVRLKLEGDQITEAEHLVARDLGEGQLANLQKPRPQLMSEVPAAYADSRGRMIWLGESYYDALDLNNSRFSNMADDCVRHENGFQTARNSFTRPGMVFDDNEFAYLGGLGCAAQMDTNMWEYIDTIENRRVDIADPVTGLVWGMSHFHHDMAEDSTRLIGVPWFPERDMSRFNAFDMPAIHIYKVWGGAIHEIEALGIVMPYQSPHSFAE